VSVGGNQKPKDLSNFCRPGWKREIRNLSKQANYNLRSEILHEIEEQLAHKTGSLDVPILDILIVDAPGAAHLPLLLDTWKRIDALGGNRSNRVAGLLSGTFLEALEQLDSFTAMLDLVITSRHWAEKWRTNSVRFRLPRSAENINEVFDLSTQRALFDSFFLVSNRVDDAQLRRLLLKRRGLDVRGPWTFRECGDLLGVTGEAFRRTYSRTDWSSGQRYWPRSNIDSELCELVRRSDEPTLTFRNADGSTSEVSRSGAETLLTYLGYDPTEYSYLGRSEDQIAADLYRESQLTGFLSWSASREILGSLMLNACQLEIDTAIAEAAMHSDVARDFVYVERSWESNFVLDVSRVLSMNGPTPFDDLIDGWQRVCHLRKRNTSHIPLAAYRYFFEVDARFFIEDDDVVHLAQPVDAGTSGAKEWVWRRVKDSPGGVIHYDELADLGRLEGLNPTTIKLYCTYEAYLKSLPGGFVTLTGYSPSHSDLQRARERAQQLRRPTVIDSIEVDDLAHSVVVEIGVGHMLANKGLWYPPEDLIDRIGSDTYEILVNDKPTGHTSWFGKTSTGWGSAMRAINAKPGDTLTIRYLLKENRALLTH
jgi:hypothetical protein